METYPVPKMSPLCQSVERDGHHVKIEIYEGDNGQWLLEVVDELGGSTVWDDQFPTDEEALKEAMKTIEKEGIASFMNPENNVQLSTE